MPYDYCMQGKKFCDLMFVKLLFIKFKVYKQNPTLCFYLTTKQNIFQDI